MWVFTAKDVEERWHNHGRSKRFEPKFKVCSSITICLCLCIPPYPYSLNSHKDYCFLVLNTNPYLSGFFFLISSLSCFFYLLMLSTLCGATAGTYIVLRIGVVGVGLEHKQKLELRLDLKNILFADSFGWYIQHFLFIKINKKKKTLLKEY